MAAGLAMAAAALAASGFREPAAAGPPRTAPPRTVTVKPVELVSAPVRIADAATVRLLRPGDRIDVIAAPPLRAGATEDGAPEARVVATGVRVTDVPRTDDGDGALVVLAVPRAAATRLAGAGASSPLVVTLR